MDSNKKNTTLKLGKICLLGLALLFITNYEPIFLELKKLFPNAEDIINITKSGLSFFGGAVILVAGFVFCFKDFIEIVWNAAFGDNLKDFLIKIETNVKIISDNISKQNNSENFLLEVDNQKLKESVVSMNKILYGSHITNPESLYSYVQKRIIDPFSSAIHRSCSAKNIRLSKNENDKFITWEETTTFKLHRVNFDEATDNHYPLVYNTKCYAPDIRIEEWQKKLTFLVSIDNEKIPGPKVAGKKPPNKDNDGYYVWKEKDWIYLFFRKSLRLSKEYTEVVMREISINGINDTCYTLNVSTPIYGHSLNFDLPEFLEFVNEEPYISPKIALDGLPKATKASLNDNIVKIDKENRRFTLEIKGWIIPGLILSIRWKKV